MCLKSGISYDTHANRLAVIVLYSIQMSLLASCIAGLAYIDVTYPPRVV